MAEPIYRDAEGTAICVGDVLRHLEDGTIGVVIQIWKAGDTDRGLIPHQVGDMDLQITPGSTRVTNRHNQWVGVPRDEQTYDLKFRSWLATPYERDEDSDRSPDEQLAVDGILALLPDNLIDSADEWPESTVSALALLARHLIEVTEDNRRAKRVQETLRRIVNNQELTELLEGE